MTGNERREVGGSEGLEAVGRGGAGDEIELAIARKAVGHPLVDAVKGKLVGRDAEERQARLMSDPLCGAPAIVGTRRGGTAGGAERQMGRKGGKDGRVERTKAIEVVDGAERPAALAILADGDYVASRKARAAQFGDAGLIDADSLGRAGPDVAYRRVGLMDEERPTAGMGARQSQQPHKRADHQRRQDDEPGKLAPSGGSETAQHNHISL